MIIYNDCLIFFVTVSGQQLWASVIGVSNAGKKKGRGKRVGRKKATDLNRGQRIGVGKFFFALNLLVSRQLNLCLFFNMSTKYSYDTIVIIIIIMIIISIILDHHILYKDCMCCGGFCPDRFVIVTIVAEYIVIFSLLATSAVEILAF